MLSHNICSEHTDNSLDKDNMCNTKNKYIHSKDKKIRDVSGKKYKNEISIITYSFVVIISNDIQISAASTRNNKNANTLDT